VNRRLQGGQSWAYRYFFPYYYLGEPAHAAKTSFSFAGERAFAEFQGLGGGVRPSARAEALKPRSWSREPDLNYLGESWSFIFLQTTVRCSVFLSMTVVIGSQTQVTTLTAASC
jgi:hypothetical protein